MGTEHRVLATFVNGETIDSWHKSFHLIMLRQIVSLNIRDTPCPSLTTHSSLRFQSSLW